MSFRNYISEGLFLNLSDLALQQCTAKSLKFLKETRSWSREQIDAYQNERLRLLVKQAATNVPYYRDLFTKIGLSHKDIQSKEDLYKIPIVDKSIMREEGLERFTAIGFPKKGRVLQRSGGSTGEPISFYTTKEENSMNLAAKLQTWYNTGYRLGDRYVKIANCERTNWKKKLQDFTNNSLLIPFSNVEEKDLRATLEKIENSKPLYIRSYPLPLYLLAQYKKRCNDFHHCPKYIFTTGSTLSEDYRETIENAFGCKIIDSYSCEGNANVSQSPQCDYYHVSEEFGITEVLDKDNNPVTNGIGRVVSTDLWNFAHPFLRYDTQDLVEVCEEPCPCGNPRKMIKRIMGRECESFLQSNGKYFTVHDLTGFLKKYDNINEAIDAYQLVKKKDGTIAFRVICNDQFTAESEQFLENYWSKQFGKAVCVEKVDKIPLLNNNKRLTIIEEK